MKILIFGHSLKSLNFKGGFHKKLINRRDYLKRGAWTVCRFKKGLVKKEGVVFFE